MLGRCKSKINDEQLAFIMERFPRIVDIYKQRGEASDEDFERLGFNLIQDEDSKDHLVLNRRRAVIFNNEGYLRREHEKKMKKDEDARNAQEAKRKRVEETQRKREEAAKKKQKRLADEQFKLKQQDKAKQGILLISKYSK